MKRCDPVIISAKKYYGPCHNLNDFLERKDGYEIFYNWSEHLNGLSRGFVYLLKCRPGLTLSIARHYPATALSIPFEEEISYVRLFFILGEGSDLRQHSQEQETKFCSNQGYLTFTPNRISGLAHCPAKPFFTIGVLMEPWFIKHFSQGIAGEFDQKIDKILAPTKKEGFFCCPVSMTPAINIRLHEILGCTYRDVRRRLFLGSKALELMISGFDQFNSDKEQAGSCFDLASGPGDFVHKARDIIISDIKNPPTLTELSRMVGVNRTTLSQGFSKIYGDTIFNFLRKFRLEESRRLLQAGNKSVTQVAFEVGYAQQRTFSREFKKYFGNSPSDYLG